jgi:ATP-dependent DNA helicase DinG
MQDFEEIFGAEGPLAAAIPGFATRDEQIAMAEHVWQALRSQGRLIVEAARARRSRTWCPRCCRAGE